MHSDRLTCGLECNYPQLLSTIRVPRQNSDLLLANQALIRFPNQALTPVLTHLLQRAGSPITLQGPDIPLFISEQLPVMRHFYQIHEEIATHIVRLYPIVSISELNPTFTLIHQYKNGIGSYTATATYQYQQHSLDMPALLAAYQGQQRFVQQHAIWFEWPANAHGLAKAIQQNLTIHPLHVAEVMGLDTRRSALISNQALGQTIVPDGTTPIERAQSIFEQLRHHGIPGGIVGEPKDLTTLFVKTCEKLLHEHQQVRILWLIPSNKKGSVTRVVHRSIAGSHVVVASLVTLRDEPDLISLPWTLVIFQELDVLLDGSPQSRTLSQLTWQWALISVPSRQAITPPAMRVLHIHEQYYEDFRTRYLFDLTPVKTVPAPSKRPLDLNLEKIANLQAESAQLQERLTVEEETEPKQLVTVPVSTPTQVAPTMNSVPRSLPQVDEEWQIILQQWQPEHWEILRLLCQDQAVRLSRAERQSHRPLSRLIDEINLPVDAQLGDLLIDPDTQILAPHLRAITEKLVGWYALS